MMGLYRGIRTDSEEWVKGNLIKVKSRRFIIPCEWFDMYGWYRDNKVCIPWLEVLPNSIAEAVGLKDKNDVEIYGAREINGKMSMGGDRTNHGFVCWSKTEFAWRVGDYLLYEVASDIEVISTTTEEK